MEYYLNLKNSGEVNIAIIYDERFKEYGISVLDDSSNIKIHFCPWCSKKLPESLYNKWFIILDKTFDNFNGFADERIPEEFKTDE